MLKIGQALRQARQHAGLSQQELATKLAVTRQTVSKWERDCSYPDVEMLVQLSQTLHCDVRVLLGTKSSWRQKLAQLIPGGIVMTKQQVQIEAKTDVTKLWASLQQHPAQSPVLLDIIDVLGQVYRKLDHLKDPAPLMNRLVNYIRVRAKAGNLHFSKEEDELIGDIGWIGAKAGINGLYMADFTDKSQFYGFLEPIPRH